MNKFIVQEKYEGTRLDRFLALKLPNLSRSYIQKGVKKGKVTVNGKQVEPKYKIKKQDTIIAKIRPLERISLRPDPSIPLKILYEDDDLLIIDKQSGLVVHAGVKNPKKTLVNALIAHYPPIKKVGDDPEVRPGIVHRLDKNVSGLMIIPKNNKAFQFLKKQFKQRKVEKIYTCLAWGKFKKREGKMDLPLAQNPKNPAKMVVVRNQKDPLFQKAQAALTEYEVLKQFDKTALIKVYLRTGRRHQIRVHFKSANHPIVNDKTYGYRWQNFLGPGRIFLHAAKLSLIAPYGKKMTFNSPLPQDLQEILDQEK